MSRLAGRAARGAWPALRRGAVAFAVVAGIGQVLALAMWASGAGELSLGVAARVGALYVGAFHHVAIRLDIRDVATPAAGSISLSIGIALLSVTLLAGWLLARSGRAVAGHVSGGAALRAARGATVAIGYAVPSFLLALVTSVETVPLGAAAPGGVFRMTLTPWQALVFPLAVGAVSGAAGGLRASLEAGGRSWASAPVAGSLRMLMAAALLSFAGLFVGGVVQPDEPVALATPTTARYLRPVLDRPVTGIVLLGHHVGLLPNEAVWTLVPAMGGCDRIGGDVEADVLCYERFPASIGPSLTPIPGAATVRLPLGEATYRSAPPGYLLFLIVPAAATVLGGMRAAAVASGPRSSAPGRPGSETAEAVRAGALAGVGFAVAVGALAALSSVTIGYRSTVGGEAARGWLVVGPQILPGIALALAWGIAGGAAGAALELTRRRSRLLRRARRGAAPR